MHHSARIRSAAPVLTPRSVAIVGASDTGGGGWSRQLYENLAHTGFPTETFLINPRREDIWGQPCYPSFAALPYPVDLALTVIPAHQIPSVLTEGVEQGLRGAIIYAAQFGEGGGQAGAERAAAVRALSEENGLRVAGPNCMGCLSLREQLLFYPSPRVRDLPKGSVGVIFQSGGTFQYWLQQAAVRGLGFSYAVSSGNELDLDLVDYLDFLIDDAATHVIACLVEGIRRPSAFMEVAEKALRAGKPIVMVKIGRTARGRAAAESHTGALAGDDVVIDAVCRKYGVIRCHDLDEMIDTSLALQTQKLPAGRGIAAACYSGGAKGLMLDYCEDLGVAFPAFAKETEQALSRRIDPGLVAENPLDTGASAAVNQQLFADICLEIAADPGIDMVAVQGQLPIADSEAADPTVFRRIAEATEKPVLAFSRLAQNVTDVGRAFQRESGVPFLQGIPQVSRVIRNLTDYAQACRRGTTPLSSPSGRAADLEDDGVYRLLAANGVGLPSSGMAATPTKAAETAADMGFPVALKLVSPQASHKTEIGGVALGLSDEDAVNEAARAMAERLYAYDPQAKVQGFLVQEMVEGLELLVGVRDDSAYGPVLTVGLGGVFVEALNDVALRLLPTHDEDIRTMLAELRGAKLLDAFRGRPPRDVEAVVRAIEGLVQVYLAYRPWLADLEINPLIVRGQGDGVCAVDVRAIHRDRIEGD